MPPLSPFGLIQETLWPNEWLILISCMMLNCTRRLQVERIWNDFIELAGTPEKLLSCDHDALVGVIKPLGFGVRRAKSIRVMTEAYVRREWKHVRELPGVGEYASRAWEIFVLEELGNAPPSDGSLVKYWNWARSNANKL